METKTTISCYISGIKFLMKQDKTRKMVLNSQKAASFTNPFYVMLHCD